MDNKDLESKKLSDLRVIATAAGIGQAETLKKSEILKQLEEISIQPEIVLEPVIEAIQTAPKIRKRLVHPKKEAVQIELNVPEEGKIIETTTNTESDKLPSEELEKEENQTNSVPEIEVKKPFIQRPRPQHPRHEIKKTEAVNSEITTAPSNNESKPTIEHQTARNPNQNRIQTRNNLKK